MSPLTRRQNLLAQFRKAKRWGHGTNIDLWPAEFPVPVTLKAGDECLVRIARETGDYFYMGPERMWIPDGDDVLTIDYDDIESVRHLRMEYTAKEWHFSEVRRAYSGVPLVFQFLGGRRVIVDVSFDVAADVHSFFYHVSASRR